MADYETIMRALRNAHAAGDTAAASRLARMARDAQQAAPEAPTTPDRTLGQTLYENIIGSGEVDTPGERAGELIRGVGAGAMRGAAQLAGLPGTIGSLMDAGAQRLGLLTEDAPERPLSGASFQRGLDRLTGGESEFRAPGTAGDYAATVGEFLPGAMGGGAGTMVRYGLLPALASETAGQATEGTALEPYARTAAALGTSLAASPRPGAFRGNSEAARMANVTQQAGVRNITQGQASGSQPLMRMEGMLQATDQQLDDFTAATMRMIGSNADTATPQNLRAVEQSLVSQMDDAVRGASIVPSQTNAQAATQLAADYVERVPAGQLTPRIRGIANEIDAVAKAGGDVPLSRLKTWRSDIGRLTTSPDAATREAAHGLRRLIDDMTDTALTTAGRTDDIAKLAAARQSYRDFIGVRDAASRAGAEGGKLSPQALNQSMIRAQGREAYATGRTTPMADFTRSAASTLRPAPTVSAGGVRTISEALPAALGGAGVAGAFGAGLGPLGMGLAGIGGALAPSMGQAVMRSNAAQSLMRNPAGTALEMGRTIPGLLAQ